MFIWKGVRMSNNLTYMTEDMCRSRHRPVIWAITTIFVALAVILTIVSMGVSASYSATQEALEAATKAHTSAHALEVYKAGQDKDTQHIIESLRRH